MHLYEMSSKLLGDTVGKVNENLTSVFLAASLVTLVLGYVSKLRLSQSCDKDGVSEKQRLICCLNKLSVCIYHTLCVLL